MKKMNLQFFADARTGVNPTNEILLAYVRQEDL